jgi:membrane associated rhomboid family serine protease
MTPWVTRLLIANAAVYVLTITFREQVFQSFGWIPALGLYRPWTILTYQFLHAGFMHLLFNMIGLFFFGPRLEARIGGRHFLGMYLVSGTVGGLLSFVTPYAIIVGASGAVFGVLLGFARYWPEERIYIWGVLPVKARVLVLALAAFSIWSGLGGVGGAWPTSRIWGLSRRMAVSAAGWSATHRRGSSRQKVEAAVPARPSGRDLKRWEAVDLERLHP